MMAPDDGAPSVAYFIKTLILILSSCLNLNESNSAFMYFCAYYLHRLDNINAFKNSEQVIYICEVEVIYELALICSLRSSSFSKYVQIKTVDFNSILCDTE